MDDIKTVLERDFDLRKVNSSNSDVDEFTLMLMNEEESKSAEDVMNDMRLASLMKQYLGLFGLGFYDDYRDVVPVEFEISTNSEYKSKILNEAIEKRIKIQDTNLYPALVEHVDANGNSFYTK